MGSKCNVLLRIAVDPQQQQAAETQQVPKWWQAVQWAMWWQAGASGPRSSQSQAGTGQETMRQVYKGPQQRAS